MSGTVIRAAVNGVATFDDLSVDRPGTYSLMATAPCLTSTSSVQFNITGPMVAMAVTPSSLTLTGVGATQQLTAQGRDAAGAATGGQFRWTSSDSGTAAVTADGLVTAVAYGSATITATLNGVSSSARVTAAPMAGALAALSAGGNNTCALTTTGAAYCWGDNEYGQLGIGAGDQWFHTTPLGVAGGLSFVALSAGGSVTCGLIAGGAAYCWGFGGWLGTAATIGECYSPLRPFPCSPVPVSVDGGLSLASLSHTCGVTAARAAWCWGFNDKGQLGNGTQTSSMAPVAVAGGLNFTSVTSAYVSACGVTTDGAAYCWGDNSAGQLGIGGYDQSPHTTPVAVTGGLTFKTVSTGGNRTCGLTTDGAVYCWGGYDGSGVPAAIPGGLTFVSVTAGGYHACGITSSGAAYCWGDNTFGQLGNGSFTSRGSTPDAVVGGLTFTSLSAGTYHTCGVTTGGVGYCWGDNGYGELGNGVSGSGSATPVLIAGQLSP